MMCTNQNELAIVLPMYKPRPGWPGILIKNMKAVQQTLAGVGIRFIVVNDGFETHSLLGMFALLEETYANLQFISYSQNKGKGFALRTGVAAAQADYVIVTDFDFPYQNENIGEVYRQLQQGYDVVSGRRNPQYYGTVPVARKLISKACICLNSWVLQLPQTDTQSGLKGFNSRGRRLFLQTRINRFLVDTEFLMMAHRLHLSLHVIELQLKPGVVFSTMGAVVLLTEAKNLFFILQRKRAFAALPTIPYHAQTGSLPDVRFGGV